MEKEELKLSKKQEKEQAKILAKERELHHLEVLKMAKEDAKKEKVAPKDAYISLCDVNKIYPNHVQAVHHFNLDIKEKEFVVFVGPSGCGKSTTIRMIAGLEDITSGDLFIGSEYANNLPPKDRKIGMVFQSYALFPHMTVYENMAFGLEVLHMNKEEIDKRVRYAGDLLQISEYFDRKPNALSGGQCQRVALGRAIVADAKIFLMDEPLSNLDAKLRVAMRSEIVRLHRSLNTTTIYVTHDQTEAMTMADRIVVMNNGYVQQIGSPAEIFNEPKNLFVATFVGSPSMNLLKGKAIKNEFVLEDGTKLDMGQDFSERIKKFYENEIAICKQKKEDNKELFLRRQKESKRYLKMFKGEEINTSAASKYLKCLDEESLKLIGVDKSAAIEEILSMKEKNQFVEKVDALLKEYLYAYHSLHNPEIMKDVDVLNRLEKVLSQDEIELILGIRPEHIKLGEKSKESISLKIGVAELLGSEYFIHLPYMDKDLVAKVTADKEIKEGESIDVSFDKKRIHLFDPIGENRLSSKE